MSNKQENPLVSVIIPTYKRPDMLGRAIDSVLNQTYNNIEIIVVDDNDENSKYRKETEEFMRKYADVDNLVYLKHKKNKNGAAARNTGIKSANGEYIAFLDDDDEWLSEKIRLQIKKLEKHKNEYGAIYCDYSYYKNNNLEYKYKNTLKGNLTKELLLKEVSFAAGSTLLIKTYILRDKLAGFDETFSRHQDWELLIRFFKEYKILLLRDNLVKVNRDNRENSPNPDDLYLIKKKYLGKFENVIKNYDKEIQDNIYKVQYLKVVKAYFNERELKKGICLIKRLKLKKQLTYIDYLKLISSYIDSFGGIKSKLIKFFRMIF